MKSEVLKRPNVEPHYKITQKDLPLSCPSSQMRVWDSHPRIFLPIEEKGEVNCPYCGAKYTLIDNASSS